MIDNETKPELSDQLNRFTLTNARGDELCTEFADLLVRHQVSPLELAYVVANVLDSTELDIVSFAQALGLFAEAVKNSPGEISTHGLVGGPAS